MVSRNSSIWLSAARSLVRPFSRSFSRSLAAVVMAKIIFREGLYQFHDGSEHCPELCGTETLVCVCILNDLPAHRHSGVPVPHLFRAILKLAWPRDCMQTEKHARLQSQVGCTDHFIAE